MTTEADGLFYFKFWVGAQHPISKKLFEVNSDAIKEVLDQAKAKWFGPATNHKENSSSMEGQ